MTDKEIITKIVNLLERWNLARDNDSETVETIDKLLKENNYLEWFK